MMRTTWHTFYYPVYENERGEWMDICYSIDNRGWYLRHKAAGAAISIRLFGPGHSRRADFDSACRHLKRKAEACGMKLHHTELRR